MKQHYTQDKTLHIKRNISNKAIDERKLMTCCMHETHTTSQEVNSPS